MISADFINGSFELGGALFLALNIRRLHRDKQVRGVSWMATAFFMVWGYWNLFFYSHIDQLYSWLAGIAVVAVNTVWLGQMLFYIAKEKPVE